MKIKVGAWLLAYFVGLTSCQPISERSVGLHEDPFYRSTGGFDSQRLPLLAPYEAISINRRDGWIVKLFSDSGAVSSVFHAQRMAICQAKLYLAAKGVNYVRGSEVSALWVVLAPPYQERVFVDSTAFYQHSPLRLQWRNMDQAYLEFVRSKTTP
ncbi:hypothetical protein [Hymenobacter negativus]|uniref:Lipoprotein n=1 Tax=Hymenobacter negativus TaxID=2795026 RepID=A0ABS3QI48_9BACT|nr:hypothetical protein [Hymenobacter negativus]MBO2010918.1 hypothetical protein [Hymenobacter negativus]